MGPSVLIGAVLSPIDPIFAAAFAAGITLKTVNPALGAAFHAFGESIAELLKLAGLFGFGALLSAQFHFDISLRGYLFAVLWLVVVRPCAL